MVERPRGLGCEEIIVPRRREHDLTEQEDVRLLYDPSKPDGQPRRCLDTSRAREYFGFQAHMDFRRGLEETIRWFRRSASAAAPHPVADT